MKKVALVGFVGLMVSGCTVTTVQSTGPIYRPHSSVYSNPYVYHQPRYRHQSHYHHVYPHCRTTYQRGFYGELRAVRVCR
jgi:hypothetical protein